MIKVEKNGREITAVIVNGESLDSDDGELWFLPKGLTGGIKISELPKSVEFQPCKICDNSGVIIDSTPMRIKRIATNKVRISIEDSGTRKYWDGNIGFKAWMEAKKATVKEREKEVRDVRFESYNDDGAWIHFNYRTDIEAESIESAVQMAEQIISEIDGAAEMRLGEVLLDASKPTNEEEFTVRVVIPILRKLGFINIKYNHGKREYGKDVVFARISEFQELEHWAAQVKYGNISGGAGAEIDPIISQADDAFKMPFYDIYTRQKQTISKLLIIISGKFTENATEKICEKIEGNALRNNLVFLDGEKIETLAERFRGRP